MDLLPKKITDFSSDTYWDNFFTKREKSFEWYADFNNLEEILTKTIKKNDKVLNIGCGNSTLGYDLLKIGFSNIINVDLNELVIKQMNEKYKKHLNENFKFLQMNVFDLKFDDEYFDIVIDKGTLDALAVNSEKEIFDKLILMFGQIEKVLASGGRYILISLLQEHVLKFFVDWINNSSKYNYIIRINKLKKKTNSSEFYPVFVIVAVKLKLKNNSSKCLFEFSSETYSKPIHTFKNEVIIDLVKGVQNFSIVDHYLKQDTLKKEVCFELFDQNKFDDFKYKFIFIEQLNRKNRFDFAIFLVPKGKNDTFPYNNEESRLSLVKQSLVKRMAFVFLNNDYDDYPINSKELQIEIQSIILPYINVSQKDMCKVPFLSESEPEKKVLYEGESQFTGKFKVFEVKLDDKDEIYRQLIFDSNKNIIQSEAKLKKNSNIIDHSFLSCNHHVAVVAGFSLLSLNEFKNDKLKFNILLIGLGGGCLASFLQHNIIISNINLDIVEIDKDMVNIAKKWFELNENFNFSINIFVEDGIDYLKKNKNKYDVIIFDIDNKDKKTNLSCPPKAFLEIDTLNNVLNCLNERGCFMLNLATRDNNLKKEIECCLMNLFYGKTEKLKSKNKIFSYKIKEETNNIYYCFKNEISNQFKLNNFIESFNSLFTYKKLATLINVNDFLKNLIKVE